MAIDAIQKQDLTEARNREVELLKSGDKTASHFLYWYAWFWAVTSAAYFFTVTLVPITDNGQHFADIILGFLLGTAVATIIGYFYGSSK
jgi:hypothetical protein